MNRTIDYIPRYCWRRSVLRSRYSIDKPLKHVWVATVSQLRSTIHAVGWKSGTSVPPDLIVSPSAITVKRRICGKNRHRKSMLPGMDGHRSLERIRLQVRSSAQLWRDFLLTGCYDAFKSRNSSENLVCIYLRTVSKPEPAPRIHDEIRRKT